MDTKLEKLGQLFEKLQKLDAQRDEIMKAIELEMAGQESIGTQAKRAVKAFEVHWATRYVGQKYLVDYPKHIPMMKTLLKKGLTLEEISGAAGRFVNVDEKWINERRHDLGLFVSQINQYRAAAPGPARPSFALEAPIGCGHRPPCKDDAEHTRRRADERKAAR